MIENLIVNGCSFTADNLVNQTTWASYTHKQLQFDRYQNLARQGAGNFYICESTIGFLETQNLVPSDTCVLVMWSGTGRKDIRISADWYFYLKDHYAYLSQSGFNDIDYYLFSGGLTNSWMDTGEVKKIFDWQYRVSDPYSLCLDSLINMIKLESYLRDHGYTYMMTSFVNLWQGESATSGDYCIPWFLKNQDIFKKYKFDNWFFVDTNKNCLGEFAKDIEEIDSTGHPTSRAHEMFANQIVIPELSKRFMCKATRAA